MAKTKQTSGPGTTRGGRAGSGKQGQGGDAARGGDRAGPGAAQQDQEGGTAQQGGGIERERDDERLDADAQSGSSPRAAADSPDDGKVG